MTTSTLTGYQEALLARFEHIAGRLLGDERLNKKGVALLKRCLYAAYTDCCEEGLGQEERLQAVDKRV